MKLYKFPQQTKVDRLIPKNKFYEQGHANTKVEQLFVDQVENIRWAYKLASSTIHLEDQEDLKEIQIFQVKSRVKDLDVSLLTFIDKLILSPIVFEVAYQDKVKIVATYKRLNQADKSKVVISQYYTSDWLEERDRIDLPIYLKLSDLYEHFIAQLLPIPQVDGILVKDNQTIQEKLNLAEQLESLEKQIGQLKLKMKRDQQFNRKVLLNQKIIDLEKKLKDCQE